MVIALAYISYFKSLFLHELNRVFYLNVLVKYDIVNIATDESESRSNKKKSICPRRNIQTYIGFFFYSCPTCKLIILQWRIAVVHGETTIIHIFKTNKIHIKMYFLVLLRTSLWWLSWDRSKLKLQLEHGLHEMHVLLGWRQASK